MVLIWMEAWAGSMGLWPRRVVGGGESRRNPARVEPSWQVPAWRRRAHGPRYATGVIQTAAALGQATARSGAHPSRSTAVRRRCWIRVDPRDRGHAAIGGSFAEVCAALERLAALEEGRGR